MVMVIVLGPDMANAWLLLSGGAADIGALLLGALVVLVFVGSVKIESTSFELDMIICESIGIWLIMPDD